MSKEYSPEHDVMKGSGEQRSSEKERPWRGDNEGVMTGKATEALILDDQAAAEAVHRMQLGRELITRFTHHPPDGIKVQVHKAIRDDGKEFAVRIAAVTPICYEQTEALKAIELAVFWANAAIARRT